MGRHKRQPGYASWSYLEPGRDFRTFPLAPQVERVPATLVPLDAAGTARADALADRCIMISLHEHAGIFPADIADTPAYVREGRMATAF